MKKIILLLFLFLSCENKSFQQKPIAVRGFIDLSSWFFENGSVALDGQWEFYFSSFEESSNKTFIKVPQNWNGYALENKILPEKGYALYKLKIRLPKGKRYFALKLTYINTAYKIFIDEEILTKSGKIGKTKSETIPHQVPGVFSFYTEKNEISLKIFVSSFHYKKSGIIRSIKIGTYEQLSAERENVLALDFFLFGVLFLFALYHFALFWLRPEEKSNLWFSVFSLIISSRSLLIEERFAVSIFPYLDWFLIVKILYIGIFLTLPSVLAFVYSLFPRQTSKKFVVFTVTTSLFATFLGILFEPNFSAKIFAYYQYLVAFSGLYIVFILIKATKSNETGAGYLLLSYFVFYITAIIAILYENDLSFSPALMPSSLIFFVFSQSYIISLKFSRAFKKVEELNETLEKKVEERTKDLELAKDSAESANAAKSQYLSFMTHELRTPINAVNGYIELMKEEMQDEDSFYLDDMNKVLMASSHLTSLINNILDMSKIEAGKIDLLKSEFSLKELIVEIQSTVDPIIYKNNNHIFISLAKDVDIVFMDRMKIKQVLLNIISNAAKFTENGQIKLLISGSEELVSFKITDTGKGMNQEEISTLFDLYTQFHEGTKKSIKGTGLGMAICKKFMDIMDGSIHVKSRVGVGTTICVSAPCVKK
jgi:signal transduction histidine kinase